MIIYPDSNIIIYCAKHEAFVLGYTDEVPAVDPFLQKELWALRRLAELDDLASWGFAAPRHLLDELQGRPLTEPEEHVIGALAAAWEMCGDDAPPEDEVAHIYASLEPLRLKHKDRRHLAEALALGASWLLTNDKDFAKKASGKVPGVSVGLPSECIEEMSRGLFTR